MVMPNFQPYTARDGQDNEAAGLGVPYLSEVLLLHKAIDLGAQPRGDGRHLLLSQAHYEPLPLSQPSFPQPATLQDK